MIRPVYVAACAAGVLFAACYLLMRAGSQPPTPGEGPGPDGVTQEATRSEMHRGLTVGGGGQAGGGAGVGLATEQETSGSSRRVGGGALRGFRDADPEGDGRSGRRKGKKPNSDGKASGEPGAEDSRVGKRRKDDGLLKGAELTEALAKALEEGDLGVLQALLISGLTKNGTRFSAEDVQALFGALLTADDYGMEKLILTHLQRLDAPPEELVNGYLEYLQSSRHPAHLDDVFKEMVAVGGDPCFSALSELMRDSADERLRLRAAQALGDLEDPRAVPLLREAIHSMGDPAAARPYIQALARLGGEDALSSLVGYVSQAGNEPALSVLQQIRDPDAAPVLAAGLNDNPSLGYQRAALAKLRAMPDPRALDDLSRYLYRAPAPLVREALDAVGRIRDPAALRVLEGYARRQADPRLAALAVRAAGRLRAQLEAPPRGEERRKDPRTDDKPREERRGEGRRA